MFDRHGGFGWGGRGHGDHHHGGEGHGRDHGRHGMGPGRGRGRIFDHGELRLVVLGLIAEQPRHGYEIIREIEDRVAGSYSPSPGVIYPTLTMLEELGHATVSEGNGKKRYEITAEGTAWLEANRTAVEGVTARMRDIRAAHGDGPAPQIVRAMQGLRLALRLRHGRGPLGEAEIQAITEALDAATAAVERS